MAMNQTQKKYAIERVNQISMQKCTKVELEYTVKSVRLTMDMKIKMVQKGKVPFKKNHTYQNGTIYLKEIFDFSSFEKDGGTDYSKSRKKTDPIRKECQRIKDQIMLGGAEEALKMIEKFQSM